MQAVNPRSLYTTTQAPETQSLLDVTDYSKYLIGKQTSDVG